MAVPRLGLPTRPSDDVDFKVRRVDFGDCGPQQRTGDPRGPTLGMERDTGVVEVRQGPGSGPLRRRRAAIWPRRARFPRVGDQPAPSGQPEAVRGEPRHAPKIGPGMPSGKASQRIAVAEGQPAHITGIDLVVFNRLPFPVEVDGLHTEIGLGSRIHRHLR